MKISIKTERIRHHNSARGSERRFQVKRVMDPPVMQICPEVFCFQKVFRGVEDGRQIGLLDMLPGGKSNKRQPANQQ